MAIVNVSAEVDTFEVFAGLGTDDLNELGLAKVDRGEWEKVGAAMRADDVNEVLRLVSEIAYDQVGITLPPIRIPSTPAAPAKVA